MGGGSAQEPFTTPDHRDKILTPQHAFGVMSDNISPSATVVAAPDHVSSELAGEEIILDLEDGTYYGLNEVGADVWALLDDPCRVSGICEELHEKYDVGQQVLENDVVDLLSKMHERGLIRVED